MDNSVTVKARKTSLIVGYPRTLGIVAWKTLISSTCLDKSFLVIKTLHATCILTVCASIGIIKEL